MEKNGSRMTGDKKYIAFIINPKSGSGDGKRTTRRFQKYLRRKGVRIQVNYTEFLEHACELATEAAVDFYCKMVVVAGGDGTVREVAHGLEGSDKPLLVIPCGTENLLANELGLDCQFSTIIDTFENGTVCPLDIASANGRCFTSIVGFGFDGKVVHRVNSARKGHIDYSNYFWPLWRTFWDYHFDSMKVEVDGQQVFDGPGLIFVGNISRYAIGLQILQRSDYSDGLLDVCIYQCKHKRQLMKHSVVTVFKRHLNSKNVFYHQGRNVVVTSESPNIQTEIDGDPGPELPIEIKVMPGAINIVRPRESVPAGIRRRLLRYFK